MGAERVKNIDMKKKMRQHMIDKNTHNTHGLNREIHANDPLAKIIRK